MARSTFGFKTLLQVTRAPFFASLVVSGLVGTAVALSEGVFDAGYFALTILGIVAVNAGLNMSNDYYDHLSGNDDINKHPTPFSGGSRTIQHGVLTPRQVLVWSLCFFGVSVAIGVYLTLVRGWVVLVWGIIGVWLALSTSAPPFRLNYRGHGLGELATFLGSGPLIVLGAYYVQTQTITPQALWTSVPVGLLGAALILINEFPDYEADRASGKQTLVVVLGKERAVWGYVALLVAVYGCIAMGIALGVLPRACLASLLTLPLACAAIGGVTRFHSDTAKLLPTNARTILVYLSTGLLLSIGYAITGVF